MGSKERKEGEKASITGEILRAARDILGEEGYRGLTVRKIANRINYSTGVIYHYFLDKDEILRGVIDEGYRQILGEIGQVPWDPRKPLEGLKCFFTRYFSLMEDQREFSKFVLLNDGEPILQRVTILEKGISTRAETFRIMTSLLQESMDLGLITKGDPELLAQIIWTTAYGLLVRFLLERATPESQKQRLMDEFFLFLDRSLAPPTANTDFQKGGTRVRVPISVL